MTRSKLIVRKRPCHEIFVFQSSFSPNPNSVKIKTNKTPDLNNGCRSKFIDRSGDSDSLSSSPFSLDIFNKTRETSHFFIECVSIDVHLELSKVFSTIMITLINLIIADELISTVVYSSRGSHKLDIRYKMKINLSPFLI